MAPTEDEKRYMIEYLREIAGIGEEDAKAYLEAFDWDMAGAINLAVQDNEGNAVSDGNSPADAEENYTGPRTLDGRPAPQAGPGGTSSSKSSRPQQKKKGVTTLASLGGGHAHDSEDDEHDDDEYEDEKTNRGDLFAGGEKSGLAVKDPNQRKGEKKEGSRGIVNDIISKAREHTRSRAGGAESSRDAEARPTRQWGSGQTVGGDGVQSRTISDPRGPQAQAQAQPQRPQEVQERTIHLWQDGFSIDDGPLHRYDDPANEEALRMIRSGRAPLDLMNVRLDQPVDARISPHEEPWRQLPRVYRPFGGEGRRLGSPVPGDGNVARPPPSAQSSAANATTTSASASGAPQPGNVDMSQPTVMLRIQMPNGTRLPARFNMTQTIGDVYDFVGHANPETRNRPFVVATTFPNKDHTDHSAVLGKMGEFKKGGTAVVKWA